MAEEEEKRVKIVSNFTSNADVFYERIEDPSTGEVTTQKETQPNIVTSNTTVKTAPYRHETGVSITPRKDTTSAEILDKTRPGFDTSEL